VIGLLASFGVIIGLLIWLNLLWEKWAEKPWYLRLLVWVAEFTLALLLMCLVFILVIMPRG